MDEQKHKSASEETPSHTDIKQPIESSKNNVQNIAPSPISHPAKKQEQLSSTTPQSPTLFPDKQAEEEIDSSETATQKVPQASIDRKKTETTSSSQGQKEASPSPVQTKKEELSPASRGQQAAASSTTDNKKEPAPASQIEKEHNLSSSPEPLKPTLIPGGRNGNKSNPIPARPTTSSNGNGKQEAVPTSGNSKQSTPSTSGNGNGKQGAIPTSGNGNGKQATPPPPVANRNVVPKQPGSEKELVSVVGNGQNKQHTSAPSINGHVREAVRPTVVENSPPKQAVGVITPSPLPAVREIPLTEAQIAASRRAKVNRLLMRKRRHSRNSKDIVPRLMLTLTIIVLVLLSVLSSSAGAAYAYYQAQLPLLNGIATHSLFQTTHIYDRNGKLLFDLYDQRENHGRRTYVNYNDISPLLVNATIAAEDHTFWTNGGVDLQGIVRAAYENALHQGVVEGGSTVTQQIIKNQIFANQERNFQIKGEEALLAYGLTQQYPKWKIMEMYLNTVYYGDLNYGAEAAAQDYFNIQPRCTKEHCTPALSQLDLAQASLLAGLPQSPTYYNPTQNKDSALTRQKVVLSEMVTLKMITPAQAQQAEDETAKIDFQSYAALQQKTVLAPHFVRYVIDQVLVPLLGADNLYDGGYSVYTTLDLNLEKKVEQITYDHLYKVQNDNYLGTYGPLDVYNNVNNAAVVVMNPYNGEILAMNGSANYKDNRPQVKGEFNAALALRQPGSTFKPIVYSTAFEMGWYPAMNVPNHKTTYPNNPPYTPNNYGNVFLNNFPMTIRNATANSINIPAIDALEYAGIPNVVNMAARLGLTDVVNNKEAQVPSMALGTPVVTPLEMTGAYATFANRGVRVPPTSILEITDNQGHPIYTYNAAHPKGIRVMSEDTAFLMSSVLSDKTARYHEFFPGNPLELDRPAAAKTGTTDNFVDNWTMGYTPYLTVGVWVGNSDNSPMQNVIGITGAGPIWHDVMEYASEYYHYPPDDFIRPDNIHAGTVSAITGLLPHAGEPTVTDWFVDGTMPTIMGSYSYIPPKQPGNCRKHCNVPPHN